MEGRVRKVELTYKNFRVGEKVNEFKGVGSVTITRGVHRIALLVPIDES